MAMKKGQHTWPYSGKVHSESDKHNPSPNKKGVNYRKPNNQYKEGKWEFIGLMELNIKFMTQMIPFQTD